MTQPIDFVPPSVWSLRLPTSCFLVTLASTESTLGLASLAPRISATGSARYFRCDFTQTLLILQHKKYKKMSPPIPCLDLLIPELFDMVLGHLSTNDMVRLGECSRRFRYRTQPAIFANENAREYAMAWACKRDLDQLFERAVAYGAPISMAATEAHGRGERIITLAAAALHQRQYLFRRLIELGARIDDPAITDQQLRSFARVLCKPEHHDTHLYDFLEANLAVQLPQKHRDFLLGRVVETGFMKCHTGPQLDIVRMILQSGASVGHTWLWQSPRSGDLTVSAASRAILSDRPDLLRLFLDMGASADRHDQPDPYKKRFQLGNPNEAAAYAMALDDGTSVPSEAVQLYTLERNSKVPLCTYLEHVSDWTAGGAPEGPEICSSHALRKLEWILARLWNTKQSGFLAVRQKSDGIAYSR